MPNIFKKKILKQGYFIEFANSDLAIIFSRIYAVNIGFTVANDFRNFRNYVENEIRTVWDEDDNEHIRTDLWSVHTRYTEETYSGPVIHQTVFVLPSDELQKRPGKDGDPLTRRLMRGECLIDFVFVDVKDKERRPNQFRSFIKGTSSIETNMRTGTFYDIRRSNEYAHEFGHIMGLADRYQYIANAYLTDPGPNESIPYAHRYPTVPPKNMYLPGPYDIEKDPDWGTQVWHADPYLNDAQKLNFRAKDFRKKYHNIPNAYLDEDGTERGMLARELNNHYDMDYSCLKNSNETKPKCDWQNNLMSALGFGITRQQIRIVIDLSAIESQVYPHMFRQLVFFIDVGNGSPFVNPTTNMNLYDQPSIDAGTFVGILYREQEGDYNPGVNDSVTDRGWGTKFSDYSTYNGANPFQMIQGLTYAITPTPATAGPSWRKKFPADEVMEYRICALDGTSSDPAKPWHYGRWAPDSDETSNIFRKIGYFNPNNETLTYLQALLGSNEAVQALSRGGDANFIDVDRYANLGWGTTRGRAVWNYRFPRDQDFTTSWLYLNTDTNPITNSYNYRELINQAFGAFQGNGVYLINGNRISLDFYPWRVVILDSIRN